MALVKSIKDVENIDLLPAGWLRERGCTLTLGEGETLETPKGRQMAMQSWHGLPYLDKKQIQQMMMDLPDADERGRSGEPAAARVSSAIIMGHRASAARLDQFSNLKPRDDLFSVQRHPCPSGLWIGPWP